MAVPVIEVDGETMIGFDEGQLSKMLGIVERDGTKQSLLHRECFLKLP